MDPIVARRATPGDTFAALSKASELHGKVFAGIKKGSTLCKNSGPTSQPISGGNARLKAGTSDPGSQEQMAWHCCLFLCQVRAKVNHEGGKTDVAT